MSVLPECSSLATARSFGSEKVADRGNAGVASRHRILDEPSLDYDSGHESMNMSSSMFEFQKAERAPQRVPLGPFSKPAPSKWDDAQKWIASPTSNRPKTGQTQVQSEKAGSRKVGNLGFGRQSSLKVVVEVPDQRVVGLEEPDTKRIDTNQTKMESGGQKFVSWEAEPYAIADSYGELAILFQNSPVESSIKTYFHMLLGLHYLCLYNAATIKLPNIDELQFSFLKNNLFGSDISGGLNSRICK